MKRMAICLAVYGLGTGILLSQSLSLKIGLFSPRLQSDLWQINQENLGIQKSDMINAYYSGEYEVYLSRHASFSLEIGSYKRNVDSQYRAYTYENGDPIYQSISLRLTPIEANLKWYPMGHRYKFFPFIGAGVGAYAWTYQQWGDFINFEDGSIREGFAQTQTFSFGWNGRIGLVFRFMSQLALELEGKYQYVKGRLSRDFEGFTLLDLGGFTANIGITYYFN
jgi:hypothetical protein